MDQLAKRVRNLAQKIPTWVWLGVFLIVLSAHSYRLFKRVHVSGVEGTENRGFVDFHNAIYFPVASLLRGDNPYSRDYAAAHADGRSFPLFPTHSLILHAPFGMLPLPAARYAYFVFELAVFGLLIGWTLTAVNVSLSVRTFAMLGAFITFTVPFYSQLYLGQLTFQLVLASLVAMHYSRNRPWLAGFALAIAACKPQFAIPIALMLLCRKDWKAVVIGGSAASIVSLLGILVISQESGFAGFVAELRANYFSLDSHPDIGTAVENYRRVDVYPLLARMSFSELPSWCKFAVPLLCLGLGGYAVFAIRKFPSLDALSNLTICLTTIGCVYHSFYDGLLLVLPLVSLWLGYPKAWRKLPQGFRWTMFVVLLFLLVNAFHLTRIQDLLGLSGPDDVRWRVLTSLSSLAILIGIVLCSVLSLTTARKLKDFA